MRGRRRRSRSNEGLWRWLRDWKNDADTQNLRALPQGVYRAAGRGSEDALLQHGVQKCQ